MSATTSKEVLDEFARVLGTDKKEGKVTLIASATNVKDEGDDIVVPGAFKESLLKRKPKVILGHDWKKSLAKVTEIREYPPGSRALKRILADAEHPIHGWPEEAGALVAEVQFNFDTQRGRDAFADVNFYEGEGEWSIGYRTRDSYRKNGTRYLKRVDLYEISLVLHGMNRWSKTLSVKDVSTGSAPASTDRGFGSTQGLPSIAVRKRDKGWALVRTDTDTDLRFFGEEDEAYLALRRMHHKGDAFMPSERMRMAEAKIAMPDGSLPVITTDDLLTAVALAGSMGEEARTHVLDRATVMGRKDLVEFPALETKKDYSKAKREEFADKGWALPDGSFPIADKEDLKNAISLAHLGSDPEKAWAHILKRAEALGAMDVVPNEKKASIEPGVTDGQSVVVDHVGGSGGIDDKKSCACEGDDCPENCDCEGCPMAAETKAGGADRNRGGAEHLRKYWTRGAGAAKIRWGVKNDFYRCVALVSKYMTTPRAKGYCANRHKDATGHWPGKGPHAGKSADMQEGYVPPEGMVVPSNTDYSSEDMDAIIEMAEGMDPDEHPDEIGMNDIGLGAKGMDADMVSAMAVNAYRDLNPDYEEADVEVVRTGIKTLADVLGDDHELHLAAGLFPEENAAFAAHSVKSVRGDLSDEEVDAVRQSVWLLSSAIEGALFGTEAKHAGPWTEQYQPGKHTGPDKPGFKRKKRKPKKPSAPSIKPKKGKDKPSSIKPKATPKTKPKGKERDEKRDEILKRADSLTDVAGADIDADGSDEAGDRLSQRRKVERLQDRARASARAGEFEDAEAALEEAERVAEEFRSPTTSKPAATDAFIPTGEYDRESVTKVPASDLSEGDMAFSSTGLRRIDKIEEMDGDRVRLTMAPDEEGKTPKVRIVEKDQGVNAVPQGGTDGAPPAEPTDEDYDRVRSAAEDAGFGMLAGALDPEMAFDADENAADIDNLRENYKDDPEMLGAMNRLFGDPADALQEDEGSRERLRSVASNPGSSDGLKDRDHFKEAYDEYVGTLGSEAATAYVANLPPEYRSAAEKYTGEKYRPINRALRKGDPLSPPEENEAIAKRLDAVFEEAPPTTKTGTVYRGLSGSGSFVDSLEPGAVVEDEGFGSTSTSEGIVTSYFANRLTGDTEFDEYGIMLNVTVPAGSKVLPMASVSDVDVEQEVLLPRGSKYRVTGKTQTPQGGYIVDVELVND